MAVDNSDTSRREAAPGPLFRFRCTACAYGASCRAAPERCPMCGCSTWEYEDWRPFFALLDDIAPNSGTLKESKL
jgi:rubrerythrin